MVLYWRRRCWRFGSQRAKLRQGAGCLLLMGVIALLDPGDSIGINVGDQLHCRKSIKAWGLTTAKVSGKIVADTMPSALLAVRSGDSELSNPKPGPALEGMAEIAGCGRYLTKRA